MAFTMTAIQSSDALCQCILRERESLVALSIGVIHSLLLKDTREVAIPWYELKLITLFILHEII